MGTKKTLSKKELEKQKKIAEEEAAAEAYQEFVATFEDVPTKSKLFVRGSVINVGSGGLIIFLFNKYIAQYNCLN